MKRACFPGSFDPITNGHIHIVQQALQLFDEVIIGVGSNTTKKYLFDSESRLRFVSDTFAGEPNVKVKLYDSLTIDFCRVMQVQYIVRGLRTSADFEFEKSIAHINQKLAPDIKTIFILSDAEYSMISSSIVRELIRYKGNVSALVPPSVKL